MNVLELVAIVHEINEMLNVQTSLIEGIVDRLSALEECDKVNRSEEDDRAEANRKFERESRVIPF